MEKQSMQALAKLLLNIMYGEFGITPPDSLLKELYRRAAQMYFRDRGIIYVDTDSIHCDLPPEKQLTK